LYALSRKEVRKSNDLGGKASAHKKGGEGEASMKNSLPERANGNSKSIEKEECKTREKRRGHSGKR